MFLGVQVEFIWRGNGEFIFVFRDVILIKKTFQIPELLPILPDCGNDLIWADYCSIIWDWSIHRSGLWAANHCVQPVFQFLRNVKNSLLSEIHHLYLACNFQYSFFSCEPCTYLMWRCYLYHIEHTLFNLCLFLLAFLQPMNDNLRK